MPDQMDFSPESLRWRKQVAREMLRETPYQWAQRLMLYADELADVEPHMALTMRVCAVLVEQATFYNSLDIRHTVDTAQERIVDDCLFVVRNLAEQGDRDQARGALEVVKHLAGVESAPVAEARTAKPAASQQALLAAPVANVAAAPSADPSPATPPAANARAENAPDARATSGLTHALRSAGLNFRSFGG